MLDNTFAGLGLLASVAYIEALLHKLSFYLNIFSKGCIAHFCILLFVVLRRVLLSDSACVHLGHAFKRYMTVENIFGHITAALMQIITFGDLNQRELCKSSAFTCFFRKNQTGIKYTIIILRLQQWILKPMKCAFKMFWSFRIVSDTTNVLAIFLHQCIILYIKRCLFHCLVSCMKWCNHS